MFLEGSVYARFDNRITVLESLDYSDLPSRVGTLETTISGHNTRIGSLETWKGIMPKRSDRYTGTTDANGDITITFPTGRYTNVPDIRVSYVFNNDNYGAFHNIKFLSKDTVLIRFMRNKNSAVLLGGNIDPDEPNPSIPVVIIATEYA